MLQKSHSLPYGSCMRTSGATYPGVPQVVLAVDSWLGNNLASPKSAILREEIPSSLDWSKRFSGLMSLWMMPWSWQYCIAYTILLVASLASTSEKNSLSRIWSKSSPPCISSMTRHQCLSSSKTSTNCTTFGWSIYFRISISVCMEILSSSLIFFLERTLTAYLTPVSLFFALLTVAKLPLPIVPSILYYSFIFLKPSVDSIKFINDIKAML